MMQSPHHVMRSKGGNAGFAMAAASAVSGGRQSGPGPMLSQQQLASGGAATLWRVMLLSLVVLCLAGCAKVLDPGPAPSHILLRPAMPERVASNALKVQLAVALPETDRSHDTDRILLVQGREVRTWAGVRWVGNAPALVQRMLLDGFQADGRLHAAAETSGIFPDYRLTCDLQAFELRREGATLMADMRVMLRLFDARKNRIADSVTFEAHIPAATDTLDGGVSALDRAASQILGDTVRWTLQNMR